MNKLYYTLLLSLLCSAVIAQSYAVGVVTMTYTDTSRSSRSVPIELHYPGVSAGNGVAVATGTFPFVVFGHGFQMTAPAYYPFADSLAERGYIVAFVNTENSFSPSHADFAKDLLFIYQKLIAENSNSSSQFLGHIVPRGAIAGHSMGGGATVLSAQYGDSAACYFTFAEATTNPSSITAAQYLAKSYLSFAGSYDCIAPYSTNQLPTYNAAASACKYLIEITGASHCNFGLSNTQCGIGETFSGCANPPLSQTDQIHAVLTYLYPYLDYHLNGNAMAQASFDSVYNSDNTSTKLTTCVATTGMIDLNENRISVYPNPMRDKLYIKMQNDEMVQISDIYGHSVSGWSRGHVIDVSALTSGIYAVHIQSTSGERREAKVIKE